MSTRDNFTKKVIDILRLRAGFICSNPDCKVLTIAPCKEDANKYTITGIAAHIHAASSNGPRYKEELTTEERTSINNGIYLCSNCATMIDKNSGLDYTPNILQKWKKNHEQWVRANLNKRISNETQEIVKALHEQTSLLKKIASSKKEKKSTVIDIPQINLDFDSGNDYKHDIFIENHQKESLFIYDIKLIDDINTTLSFDYELPLEIRFGNQYIITASATQKDSSPIFRYKLIVYIENTKGLKYQTSIEVKKINKKIDATIEEIFKIE